MGLQGQLNDISSDSIPLLLVALIGTAVRHLRSFIFSVFHCLGLFCSSHSNASLDESLLAFLGSGLASLVLVTEQRQHDGTLLSSASSSRRSEDCVVCLSRLREGDILTTLPCHHVYHKHCIDGWVDRLNFTCPLCRYSVIPEERVQLMGRRVGSNIVAWFYRIH